MVRSPKSSKRKSWDGKKSSKSRKRTAAEASVSKLVPTSTYMDEESQYTLEDQKKNGKQSGSSSSSSKKGRICMAVAALVLLVSLIVAGIALTGILLGW